MAASDYNELNCYNEAMERLRTFKTSNTEAANYEALSALIDAFIAGMDSEVHG